MLTPMLDLLMKEERWTKHAYARNEFGTGAGSTSESAVCWCLAGALTKCYQDSNDNTVALAKLHDALPAEYNRGRDGSRSFMLDNITSFNDDVMTTHQRMLEVVRKAGI